MSEDKAMEYDTFIFPDGKLIVEVKDRGQHLCSDVYKITASMGKQLSDEELPDCAPQTESVTS